GRGIRSSSAVCQVPGHRRPEAGPRYPDRSRARHAALVASASGGSSCLSTTGDAHSIARRLTAACRRRAWGRPRLMPNVRNARRMLATPSKSLFHSVAVGFMVGYGVIFLPAAVLGLAFSGMASHMGWGAAIALMFVGVPLILAANSYVLAALVMLGLLLV